MTEPNSDDPMAEWEANARRFAAEREAKRQEDMRRAVERSRAAAKRAQEAERETQERELALYDQLIAAVARVLAPVVARMVDEGTDLEMPFEERLDALKGLDHLLKSAIDAGGVQRMLKHTNKVYPQVYCHEPIAGGLCVWDLRKRYAPDRTRVDGVIYPLVSGPNWIPGDSAELTQIDALVAAGAVRLHAWGTPLPAMTKADPKTGDGEAEARAIALKEMGVTESLDPVVAYEMRLFIESRKDAPTGEETE